MGSATLLAASQIQELKGFLGLVVSKIDRPIFVVPNKEVMLTALRTVQLSLTSVCSVCILSLETRGSELESYLDEESCNSLRTRLDYVTQSLDFFKQRSPVALFRTHGVPGGSEIGALLDMCSHTCFSVQALLKADSLAATYFSSLASLLYEIARYLNASVGQRELEYTVKMSL